MDGGDGSPTVEKRGAIVDVLADDFGGGIEFSRPLDNGTRYWQWCGGGCGVGCITMTCP